MRRRVRALKFRNKHMDLVPDGVFVEYVLPHLSPYSLGDICTLSEVSQRFRRLLAETLSSYGRIVREFGPDLDRVMRYTASQGLRDLVLYCVRMGTSTWGWEQGMWGAAEGGHQDIVEYFVAKGARDWDLGMSCAAKGGHRELVDYFVSKGATDWYGSKCWARKGGHRDVVVYCERLRDAETCKRIEIS